jgi:hypothetical protein
MATAELTAELLELGYGHQSLANNLRRDGCGKTRRRAHAPAIEHAGGRTRAATPE